MVNWGFIMVFLFLALPASSQTVTGRVWDTDGPVQAVSVRIVGANNGAITDAQGNFTISDLRPGYYQIKASALGYLDYTDSVKLIADSNTKLNINLKKDPRSLNEVVVTGTMKEMSKLNSPIPVEVFTPEFFRKNPTPSLFESIGMINGVQPQINCNVCNTGDIHINGMEGPYTMVLIDGMPIVSGLSTVYGLSGIPNSMVERIEVVKGPAGALYGSEAMGGIINVITKDPLRAPLFSADMFATGWKEFNLDGTAKFRLAKSTGLVGVNYFNYNTPIDQNKDGFTDATLQDRVSLFQKWAFDRKDKKIAQIAARYVKENRWGGQTNWSPRWRGSDSIYGEHIITGRWELIGQYQLPLREKLMTQFSWNRHSQDSWYGTTPFTALQQVAFAQAYWDKNLGQNHAVLLGASFRYTFYDDNTPGTANADSINPKNQPMKSPLPGIFVQDEWRLNERHGLLTGYRFDYDRHHGPIHSPRLAYRWTLSPNHVLRGSFGTGFRVVHLFTEDHAALSGAREVVITEQLRPERSRNFNLNYNGKCFTETGLLGWDLTGFYTYFDNKIIVDLDTDPRKIIYENLRGDAISRGVSLNLEASFRRPFRVMAGVSYMDVFSRELDVDGYLRETRQLHAPQWSGNFLLGYKFNRNISLDFTGIWNGPMRLPILPNDFRPEYSPWYCIANLQMTKKWKNGLELYGGVKNLFDFIPSNPIMRPFDPFDKTVDDPIANPMGYKFDPAYNYASLQGIRGFAGIRYQLRNK